MSDLEQAEGNEAVVRSFYEDLWNQRRRELVDEIVSQGLRFRNSLGAVIEGRDEFKRYMDALLTACGARIEYEGAGFFRLSRGVIEEGWVVGDTAAFWRGLGQV
jgi:hypothetical protein